MKQKPKIFNWHDKIIYITSIHMSLNTFTTALTLFFLSISLSFRAAPALKTAHKMAARFASDVRTAVCAWAHFARTCSTPPPTPTLTTPPAASSHVTQSSTSALTDRASVTRNSPTTRAHRDTSLAQTHGSHDGLLDQGHPATTQTAAGVWCP